MTFFEEIKGDAIITALSIKKDVPCKEIEAALQEAIDEAWRCNDPESRDLQRELFRGKKPSPALFIARLAQYAKSPPDFKMSEGDP